MYVYYGLEHADLEDDNARVKADLCCSQDALEVENSTNSANLKGLYDQRRIFPLIEDLRFV